MFDFWTKFFVSGIRGIDVMRGAHGILGREWHLSLVWIALWLGSNLMLCVYKSGL